MTRHQAVDHYLAVVRECIETGVIPRCHFEDITRADFYGFVVPFATALMELSRETGVPVKIRACDTMGYGVTYPGAVLPRSVEGIIYGLVNHAGVPSEWLEWHGHNDFYRAVNNASYAWLYGACSVNCALLGIGERTGNTPLEAMVIEYAQLRGTLDGIYNIFNTDKLLNRPVKIAISNTSGTSGIAHWINTHFHLDGEEAVKKTDELVEIIYQWVNEQYNQGRVTMITDEELEVLTLQTKKELDEGKKAEA